MKCSKCQLEFCWICLGRYVGYRHDSQEETTLCAARLFFYFFLALLIIVVFCSRIFDVPIILTIAKAIFNAIIYVGSLICSVVFYVLNLTSTLLQILIALFTVWLPNNFNPLFPTSNPRERLLKSWSRFFVFNLFFIACYCTISILS